MVSASASNGKCDQLSTPLSCQKFSFKPLTRRLWDNNEKTAEYDIIDAPQFVDFCNIPDANDSFFDKVTVFASTPFPNSRNSTLLRSLKASDNTIASLSGISFSSANDTVKEANNDNNKNKKSNETCVVHNSVLNADHKEATDNIIKQPCTKQNPFSFDARQKLCQARKQERVNKLLDEQNKVKPFRANPLPKFIKTRQVLPPKDSNNEKIQNTKVSEKLNTKTNEPKKDFRHIKPPLLLTATRALERKRFDDAIKEKEKKKEELKKMENILKKQQEDRELAKLRSQTVHKAQPVPNYKNGLPSFRKRPLTDPSTPLLLKRRRQH